MVFSMVNKIIFQSIKKDSRYCLKGTLAMRYLKNLKYDYFFSIININEIVKHNSLLPAIRVQFCQIKLINVNNELSICK